MRSVIVYDRVNKWGGAERVLLTLHEMYPDAPLYTSVYDSKKAQWAKVFPGIKTSFLQHFPFAKSNHEFFAPLMPLVFESFDFSAFDLVITVTSEAAKGIRTKAGTVHICYCLTPTRYLWSGYGLYFKNPFLRFISEPIIKYLRDWDKRAAKRPDLFVSISTDVRYRIKKYYGRKSDIVFPPVEIHRDHPYGGKYFLVVSRLDFGYKKVDLVIETFNEMALPLVIVGSGRETDKLKKMAGKNIKFAGRVSDKKLAEIYSNAKALIMPQEEDFGIVSVEAQSHRVPVIAFKKGGATDTVIDGKTGVFFDEQTVESLNNAILRFEKMDFKADNLLTNAKKFSKEKFKRNFAKIVEHATKKR